MEKTNENSKLQFLRLIKIRIGEPITAIDIRQEIVTIGAISGYIGSYNVNTKELIYVKEVFEEIIRGLEILENNHVQVSVGDYSALVIDLNDINNKSLWDKQLFQSHLSKNIGLCATTMTFLRNGKILQMVCAPTQNKDANYDISTKKQQFEIYDIALKSSNIYQDQQVPNVCVPFDFQNKLIVWVEYLKNNVKQIQILNLDTKKLEVIIEYDKQVSFISHARIEQNLIVYIINHSQVWCVDILSKKNTFLYNHTDTIHAITVNLLKQAQNQQSPLIEEHKDNKNGNIFQNSQLKDNTSIPLTEKQDIESQIQNQITLDDIQICSIDYNLVVKVWEKQRVTKYHNLYEVPDIAEMIKQYQYIFDMGYPYYIKYKYDILAFSSDIGVCIYRM